MTVPFFGDQAFWGEMCRRAGVGPAPVAIELLTPQRLLDGLSVLLRPEVNPLPCYHGDDEGGDNDDILPSLTPG